MVRFSREFKFERVTKRPRVDAMPIPTPDELKQVLDAAEARAGQRRNRVDHVSLHLAMLPRTPMRSRALIASRDEGPSRLCEGALEARSNRN
jgi:hypothetical protein